MKKKQKEGPSRSGTVAVASTPRRTSGSNPSTVTANSLTLLRQVSASASEATGKSHSLSFGCQSAFGMDRRAATSCVLYSHLAAMSPLLWRDSFTENLGRFTGWSEDCCRVWEGLGWEATNWSLLDDDAVMVTFKGGSTSTCATSNC
jgi:hypothetical protein